MAQLRLEQWGRGGGGSPSQWSGGQSVASLLDGTASTLALGKQRLQAKVQRERLQAEEALRRAAMAEAALAAASESQQRAEWQAAAVLSKVRYAEEELERAVQTTTSASTRAARAEAAALDAAATAALAT